MYKAFVLIFHNHSIFLFEGFVTLFARRKLSIFCEYGNQSKYAFALFKMSFWEALTADNSSLAHTMFARYSTCSFFILTEMEVCVLVHFT